MIYYKNGKTVYTQKLQYKQDEIPSDDFDTGLYYVSIFTEKTIVTNYAIANK